MLRIEGLHKRFGDIVALNGCSVDVERGTMLGLLGPNGAGKTTTMRAIFGLVRVDDGTVTWDGEPVGVEQRRRFGFMPEERGLYPKMTVHWQLVHLGKLHGMSRVDANRAADEWLEVVGLADRRDAKASELSHGNQQRIQLGAALLHHPELVVLDEPFGGLDPIASETLADLLLERARQGTAVIFSSHQLDVVEDLCEDVAIINRGRVVLEGKVSELRAAAPRRYVDVTSPTGDESWVAQLPGARVVQRSNGRLRVVLDEAMDIAEIARVAGAGATQFVVEPPPLSEVFREVARET
ncbi:MAG: ABC transporter ATP-binding protein [Acidimicrobiia bacterium]|nr:ABC transporter ATP-binding protein [Acidimicrobiia bacterium]